VLESINLCFAEGEVPQPRVQSLSLRALPSLVANVNGSAFTGSKGGRLKAQLMEYEVQFVVLERMHITYLFIL
jgi:hypothetical protein